MIIKTIEELRLSAPSHALDSIDGMVGFIDNSEHDFLEEKLGTPLYEALCKWYDGSNITRSTVADYETGHFNRLLLLAQRCVAFDALGRAAGMQVVSVNNAGINQMTAEDYKAADDKAVDTYRQTCQKEAHATLNQLLRQLEQWCQEDGKETDKGVKDTERSKIVELWQQSSYYYLAAALLIPSCQVLQQYLNIYDSREKFIQMLPDLRFIQEEQITPAIGETLMLAVIDFSRDGKIPDESPKDLEATLIRLVNRIRKVMAALLVERTSVLKYTKDQKIQAHDDGVRMLDNVVEYLRRNQTVFPVDMVKDAPWYVNPTPAESVPSQDPSYCHQNGNDPTARNNKPGSEMFVTPPLL